MKLLLTILVGAGIGAALGYFGKCTSGACPLTATWWRGALFGGLFGAFFAYSSGPSVSSAEMDASSPQVQRVDAAGLSSELKDAKVPVVADFYATWCGPCKKLAPQLESLAKELQGRARFVKINVDQSPDLAKSYSIEAIPTVIVFHNGEVRERYQGAPGLSELRQRLIALAPGK